MYAHIYIYIYTYSYIQIYESLTFTLCASLVHTIRQHKIPGANKRRTNYLTS